MTKNKEACILLLNDIHVSKDNIPDYRANWHEALELCTLHGIKKIAFGGDMFQSRSSQTLDVLLAVHDALLEAERSGIHVILANGNHDLVNQESLRGYCHIFDRHSNVTVVDDFHTLVSTDWNFTLYIMSYFPESGSFIEKLDTLKNRGLDLNKRNYLYIHEGIRGALSQPSETELPASIFGDFDRVFVGHYHNKAVIPGTPIEYIGSSRQHNFGEDEEKGYTVLYTDGSYEFVKNRANTRYRVMDVAAEKAGVHLADELDEIRAAGQYKIKVRIHGRSSQLPHIDKRALFEAGASKVEVVADDEAIAVAPESELLERYDCRKISERYREFCRQRTIDDPEYGLMYLSQISEMPCGN